MGWQPAGWRLVGWLLTGAALSFGSSGCTDTRYPFFDETGGLGGEGSTCSTPDCGSGAQGSGGAAAANPCENPEDPSSPPVRLELVKSGLCFALGRSYTLVNDPAYLIALVPCDADESELWALHPKDPGTAFENVSSGFNLDVQFAATDDGTPFVLFEPHSLYNQRFEQLAAEGGFALSPLHAPGKCLTERDGVLALLPCDPVTSNQTIRILECLPPAESSDVMP